MFTKSLKRGVTLLAVFSTITSLVPVINVAAQEVPRCTVVSNASVQEGGADSSVVERNTTWFDITGASWIWGDSDNNVSTTTQTFSKSFIVNGTSTAALLTVAADNGYSVKVNGSSVGDDKSTIEDNFHSVTEVNILSKLVMNAENVIEITVTNFDITGINPAGLAFKIDMTGNTCEPEVCKNIPGFQATLPKGYTQDGNACYPNVTSKGEDKPMECIGTNLPLVNGSFESEVANADSAGGGFYEVFETITGWTSAAKFEMWNKMFGGASDVDQNAELGVETATKITQPVTTTPGNVYQVSIDFAPRTGENASQNALELFADADSIGSVQGDGSADATNSWTTHTYNFTATNASTVLGLEDIGTPDSVGTLIDNVRVCLVEDNTPVVEVVDEEPRRNGGSSGTRVADRNPRTPIGEVLGASTSTPARVVLGEATTTMPVGAPNTGSGGTAPVSVSLPTMVAILGHSARKSK